jgi:hypothetical protein
MKIETALALVAVTVLIASANVVADDATDSGSLSYFGIGSCCTNNRSAQDNARWVPQMAAIGIHFARTCETQWGAIEPEQGKWRWDALDEQMKYLKDQQIGFGAMLLGSPKWNTLDHPGTLPVNNLAGWSKYVTELATHVKGEVKYFEVWNEPPNFTGRDQTPADYAKIVVSAYDAAHAVDPHCMVGLAAKSVDVNYLEQVIKAGARNHFDYVVLHPYEVLNGVAENAGTEPVYLHIVPVVRKMLAAQDPEKVNVPIMFTELGSDAAKGLDKQGQTLVKAYTMGLAQGVAGIQWFEGMDGDSGPMGLLDRHGKPRPAYTAMAQMIKHLGQQPEYLGWVLLNDKDYGFVFHGPAGDVLCTWAPKSSPNRVDFGKSVQVVDPLTGSITTASGYDLTVAPVLVLDLPESLVAQAKEHKAMPLPWGGNYADAKSVSVTMGERNIEKGLHTLSGDAVAQAVVAYGGSARAGSVPGGNMFIVDPEFLSYTPTPIEISVVVRRNEANDPAGFNLVYESTNGFKHAGGWYTIPDNKEWHTMTWRIDDPEFVNYWGYNFTLNSDGNKFNKYYIQSVTVKKLE